MWCAPGKKWFIIPKERKRRSIIKQYYDPAVFKRYLQGLIVASDKDWKRWLVSDWQQQRKSKFFKECSHLFRNMTDTTLKDTAVVGFCLHIVVLRVSLIFLVLVFLFEWALFDYWHWIRENMRRVKNKKWWEQALYILLSQDRCSRDLAQVEAAFVVPLCKKRLWSL